MEYHHLQLESVILMITAVWNRILSTDDPHGGCIVFQGTTGLFLIFTSLFIYDVINQLTKALGIRAFHI